MGLFGKNKKPTYTPPPAPKYLTMQELMAQAQGSANQYSPLALNAREGALSDLSRGNAYYEGYQPTSFEQALGSQNFADVDRLIKQSLSMSGMESSPILAQQRAKAGASIGEYLSNLGNQRAQYSLQSRLGIDPYGVYNPYLSTATNQGNMQTEGDYQAALQAALANYQNALEKYKAKSAGIGAVGSLIGGAGGFLLGGPAGAMLGANLGGTASTFFGGSGSPVSMSDVLAMYQATKKQPTMADLFNMGPNGGVPQGNPMGTAQPVGLPQLPVDSFRGYGMSVLGGGNPWQ